jgi:hypothetical protein
MNLPNGFRLKLPENIIQNEYRNFKIVPVPGFPGVGSKRFMLLIPKEWIKLETIRFFLCLIVIVGNNSILKRRYSDV